MDSLTFHSLRLHGIRKSYGSRVILDDVTLEIEAGEFLVLLGPSGSGKSTLLHIIAGLEEITAGQVLIGGRDVTALEPGERDIAMIFQTCALYPTMSARENLGFALRTNGVPRQEVANRVNSIARLLQIESLLDRRPAQLSGGQQQRVAIGRALIRNPALFLLDEPLSNLDTKARADMRDELRRLHHRTRTTTVYVTHDHIEAMTLATRIAVLKEGRIRQCDCPDEVYRRPADLFVASFVGAPTMRFLNGTFHRTGNPGAVLSLESGQGLSLTGLSATARIEQGRRVVLGIRPEDIHVLPKDAGNGFVGEVLRTELTGPDAYLAIDIGGNEVLARVPPKRVPALQEQVTLQIDASSISLFCARDGSRLN